MEFVDIHSHALFGVDDGAKTQQEMYAMLSAAYSDGVRHLCLTPHSHPGYFGYNQDKALRRFEELSSYVSGKYPDMHLYLGSELRFADQGQDWLEQGICRSLNGTEYVLTDFDYQEERGRIMKSLRRMLNAGYKPVLAHAERYVQMDLKSVRELKESGVIIQVNAGNIIQCGPGAPWRAKRLISMGLADVVASDLHNARQKNTLTKAYYKVCLYYGKKYADRIFYSNPLKLLQGGDR